MQISHLIARVKLPFREDKELYSCLYEILGFYPNHIDYYKTALLHSSAAKRNDKGKPVNNERLEFLGDAILSAVVGDIVYRHFPGKREGFLTNTRSKLVQRDTLGKLANEMGINELIKAAAQNQNHNNYMGGNAFEALVGAIYLDQGYDACMKFMKKRILKQMINIDRWPCPSPGDLSDPRIEPTSPRRSCIAGRCFTTEPLGSPYIYGNR